MTSMAVEPMAMPTAVGMEMLQPSQMSLVVDRPAQLAGRQDFAYEAAKRVLDVAAAIVLLLMLLPVFAAVGLAIVLDTRGPVFYRAERVGIGGGRFRVVKFRSMCAKADSGAHAQFIQGLMRGDGACAVYKVPNDTRVTRVGAFLRRTSVDELPQLWNVLRGDMSLVGPRPDVPYAADAYEPWMRRRLLVKPGMTGLWQVSGRSRLSLLDMYRLDATYADTASLRVDLRILAQTIPAVLRPEAA